MRNQPVGALVASSTPCQSPTGDPSGVVSALKAAPAIKSGTKAAMAAANPARIVQSPNSDGPTTDHGALFSQLGLAHSSTWESEDHSDRTCGENAALSGTGRGSSHSACPQVVGTAPAPLQFAAAARRFGAA